MIKVKYEEYDRFTKEHKHGNLWFKDLDALKDLLLSSINDPKYIEDDSVFFPESRGNECDSIFLPESYGRYAKIRLIERVEEENEGILYSDGELTAGRVHYSKAIQEILKECIECYEKKELAFNFIEE